jgi:hypothetical protein
MHMNGYQSLMSGKYQIRKSTATRPKVTSYAAQQQQAITVFGAYQIAIDFVEDITPSGGLDASWHDPITLE